MPKGLWFRNVDLHVHTPASDCFLDKSINPEQIVQQAISAGLDAIAITDHNSATWIDKVKSAAEGSNLTVFPGVEITVSPGVHVLAIFPEYRTSEHVTDLLAELGLGTDSRGNPGAVITRYGIQEVLSIICSENHQAIPILAHIDAAKGVWTELGESGQTLIQLWNSKIFMAVEIVGDNIPEILTKEPFIYQPARYWASDNPHPDNPLKHSHLGIGSRISRFKLDNPITFDGLRHCFQDPEVRIKLSGGEEDKLKHSVLESITIRGGFLSGLDIELTPNLNAVIGGRGTGKSSLLEVIRYAFDLKAKTDANARQANEIIEHTFPAGSFVTIGFRLADGTVYRVERRARQEPIVYRQSNEEPVEVHPHELLPIEVYGQKEIYEISKNPAFQLNLLDNYIKDDLKPLQGKEGEYLRQLRDNAAEILHIEEDIATAQEWLSRLGAIKEELRRMENKGFVATIEQKRLYGQEAHLVNLAQDQINHLIRDIESFSEEHRFITNPLNQIPKELPNCDILEKLGELIREIDLDFTNSLQDLKERISKKWEGGQNQREIWLSAYKTQDKAYQELIQEFQGSEDADRYIQLQQRKTELEERDREVKQQKSQVNKLYLTRETLLANIRRVRREKFELRRKKANKLTQALNSKVKITVQPQGYRDSYKEYLQKLFAGLNVRNPYRDKLTDAEYQIPEQEAKRPVNYRGETVYLTPRIPHYLDPIDLAAAIRAEQTRSDEEESVLETQFGIDSDSMRRNIAGLNQSQLFELETYEIQDLPIIELQIASGDLGYRRLDALSVGQRCTALLSLVLLESPEPLVIDQPEDDLDNQFIFDQIVTTLRKEKEKRQFIIATHNANIPVSGDAELIIVLQADESHGWIDENGIGSIDTPSINKSVEQILEGGEVAFRIRKEKYGIK